MNWNILLTPAVIWIVIPVTSILVWGVVSVVQQIHRHQERQAMIDQGIHPDFPPEDDLVPPKSAQARRSA